MFAHESFQNNTEDDAHLARHYLGRPASGAQPMKGARAFLVNTCKNTACPPHHAKASEPFSWRLDAGICLVSVGPGQRSVMLSQPRPSVLEDEQARLRNGVLGVQE